MIQTTEYAVGQLNAAGGLLGRQIQLIAYDTQSSMQLYSQYAQQLVLKDRVDVVQGGITSASREAIRPTLDRYKTLYFYNTQYEGGVCDRNVFCTGTTPAQTVDHVVTYAQKTWGKKAYIIAADYNYGQITAKWMTKFVRDGGGSVARTDFFPLDVTNFSSAISRIQQAAPGLRAVRAGRRQSRGLLPAVGRGRNEEQDPDGIHGVWSGRRTEQHGCRHHRRHRHMLSAGTTTSARRRARPSSRACRQNTAPASRIWASSIPPPMKAS